MKISLIGTGRMGNALMKVLAPHFPQILWGSRSKEQVKQLIASLGYENVLAATHEEALSADLIITALWYEDLLPWLDQHRSVLQGKILIDITNPFNDSFDDFILPFGVSAAEEIQKHVPATRVVGAFKNIYFQVFDHPIKSGHLCDNWVTSDDEAAKQCVMEMLQPLPFRILDAGGLKNNRTIERMTLLAREISIRHDFYPYVGSSLFS